MASIHCPLVHCATRKKNTHLYFLQSSLAPVRICNQWVLSAGVSQQLLFRANFSKMWCRSAVFSYSKVLTVVRRWERMRTKRVYSSICLTVPGGFPPAEEFLIHMSNTWICVISRVSQSFVAKQIELWTLRTNFSTELLYLLRLKARLTSAKCTSFSGPDLWGRDGGRGIGRGGGSQGQRKADTPFIMSLQYLRDRTQLRWLINKINIGWHSTFTDR